MVIELASSVASPTTSRPISTAPSPASTARLAVAVIVEVPPSMISAGSAATVTTSAVSTTITSNVISATFVATCTGANEELAIFDVPVIVTLAAPATAAVTVTLSPDTAAVAASPSTEAE